MESQLFYVIGHTTASSGLAKIQQNAHEERRNRVKKPVRSQTNHEDAVDPTDFGPLSHLDFLEWVTGLKKASGEEPGFSSLNGHQSALKNTYRDDKKQLSPEFSSELANTAGQTTTNCKAKQTPAPNHPLKTNKHQHLHLSLHLT